MSITQQNRATGRTTLTLSTLALSAGLALATPSIAAAASTPAATPTVASTVTVTVTVTVAGVACTNVREIGTPAVVRDKGMSAFTVRQYLGYCTTGTGKAWMNFSSTYVWQQYHVLGFGYRAWAGVAPTTQQQSEGSVLGPNRQRLTWSKPVRTVNECTQGWGKLWRGGAESAQGLTSVVC